MESTRIHRIMRCPERVSAVLVDMVVSYVNATMFKMQIGIYIAERIVTDFNACLRILSCKLLDNRSIIGSIIFSKVTYITAELYS